MKFFDYVLVIKNKIMALITDKKFLKAISFLSYLAVISYTTLKVNNEISKTSYFEHYSRVDVWIKSSECTLKTNAFLYVCDSEKLIPIEIKSLADDRGQTLISNLYSYFTKKIITKNTLVNFNLLVNLTGYTLMFLFLYRKRIFASILLSIIFYKSQSLTKYVNPDAPFSYPGLALISVWCVLILSSDEFKKKFWQKAISLTLLFGFFSLFRESIFFATALGFVAFNFISILRKQFSFKLVLASFLLLFVSKTSNSSLLKVRDIIGKTEASSQAKSHGISHNLFIGLGSEDNSWGIKWDDSVGQKFAEQVNPNVAYASEEYFSILWGQYVRFIAENPLEAAKIYKTKTEKTFRELFKMLTRVERILIFLIALYFLFKRKFSDDVLIVSLLAAAQSLLPILTINTYQFLISSSVTISCLILTIATHYSNGDASIYYQRIKQAFKAKKRELTAAAEK